MAKTLEFVHTEADQYMWRFKAGNGRKVSWSGETYRDLSSCIRGALLGSPVTQIDSVAVDEERESKGKYYDLDTQKIQECNVRVINLYTELAQGTAMPITTEQSNIVPLSGVNATMDEGHITTGINKDIKWHPLEKHDGGWRCSVLGCYTRVER